MPESSKKKITLSVLSKQMCPRLTDSELLKITVHTLLLGKKTTFFTVFFIFLRNFMKREDI